MPLHIQLVHTRRDPHNPSGFQSAYNASSVIAIDMVHWSLSIFGYCTWSYHSWASISKGYPSSNHKSKQIPIRNWKMKVQEELIVLHDFIMWSRTKVNWRRRKSYWSTHAFMRGGLHQQFITRSCHNLMML